jgi:hypothetical protein
LLPLESCSSSALHYAFAPLPPEIVFAPPEEKIWIEHSSLCVDKLTVNVFNFSYAAWSGYPYNQQGNPTAAYSYSGSDPTSASNSGTSSYPQYSQHQSNSQYSYGASNAVNANEYYSHYGYSAPQPTSNVYAADPNGLFIYLFFVHLIFFDYI